MRVVAENLSPRSNRRPEQKTQGRPFLLLEVDNAIRT